MRSLKDWADSIIQARAIKETRENKESIVRTSGALAESGGKKAIWPMAGRLREAGSAWYSIGMKSFKGLRLSAADEEDVSIEKSCEVCDHPYVIRIKAWKIRSCDCAAAPCPKCLAFQIVDLDAIRKSKFGAC
jgi:hypothetical protein